MLVSRHVASYVPDLPAIKIHQIKDEEWREEDKLYFPICVFLLFLWFVLIDLHFVLTHVGHIWHWFPVCQHHPRPDMAKNYPSRQTDRQTPTPWNIDGYQVTVRAFAVRDLSYGGWTERMLKLVRGIQTVGMRALLLSKYYFSFSLIFSFLLPSVRTQCKCCTWLWILTWFECL